MMYVHSLGRAVRYYPEHPALLGSEAKHSIFRELHDRVAAVAAGLSQHEFRAGDRLAMLLPNEPEYLELIYACSWLGVIAVPVNARSSATEIDLVLADASPEIEAARDRREVPRQSDPAPLLRHRLVFGGYCPANCGIRAPWGIVPQL